MSPPIPTSAPHPASLWEGFWGIQLLHIGQSLGLLQALGQPLTAKEVAEKLQLELRYTELWCSAAHASGLLEQSGQSFSTPQSLREWLDKSRGFTESHLHLSERMNETFQAVFRGRALPEPPISLRLILAESLTQNYHWAFGEVPAQVPGFAKALQRGTRALEVGCGIGLGLTVLRSYYSNLELYGLEGDYECAREAERATRAVIHLGDLPTDRFGKSFDLVVCFRALNTSNSPDDLLCECAGLLSSEGWLVLGTEIQDERGPRKTMARSLSEHFAYQLLAGESEVNFFHRQRLLDMLDRCGLKLQAEVEAPDWGTPLFFCTRQGNSDRM